MRGSRPRTWIKLHVNGMLNGSVRYQLSPAERSVWVDLLVLAATGPCPGIISDNDQNSFPRSFIANRLNVPLKLLIATLLKCEQEGRITIIDGVIKITNWSAYQSEYDRQLPYRQQKLQDNAATNQHGVTAKVTMLAAESYPLDKIRPPYPPEGGDKIRLQTPHPTPPVGVPKTAVSASASFEDLHNKNGLFSELAMKFPSLDLADELHKCSLWWSHSKKKVKSPELAFRNWLSKALVMLTERKLTTKERAKSGYTGMEND